MAVKPKSGTCTSVHMRWQEDRLDANDIHPALFEVGLYTLTCDLHEVASS